MEETGNTGGRKDRVRVKRETLEKVLEQCQIAIQKLAIGCDGDDQVEDVEPDDFPRDSTETSSAPFNSDTDIPEFYDLLESRVGCADFLKKLENAQSLVPSNIIEEGSSWNMAGENDLWECGNVDMDSEDYILVSQDDIMDGIAAFMAAYLLSLKQTKVHYGVRGTKGSAHAFCALGTPDLTPNQLQEVLRKTFSVKKKKGKLKKAWDGSKVIYNVASWGATAIGIYQNPAFLKAASAAFWTSCHVVSKLF